MKSRIEILKEYLKDDPDDSFSNYGLALEYMSMADYQSAVEILEKVLQRDEKYLAVYYQLGKVYEKLAKVDDAKLIYQKGILVAFAQKNGKTMNELKSAYDSLTEDE